MQLISAPALGDRHMLATLTLAVTTILTVPYTVQYSVRSGHYEYRPPWLLHSAFRSIFKIRIREQANVGETRGFNTQEHRDGLSYPILYSTAGVLTMHTTVPITSTMLLRYCASIEILGMALPGPP